ncbi:hypothetical protein WT37_26525 [Burkholderia territorii]|nr:hypothetical protein WT37_26525 [Burkholderia territorii]
MESHAEATTGHLPDGVIATVNGVSLTQAQLDAVLHATRQPDGQAVRQDIRRGLIARELVRQAAESQGLGTSLELQGLTDDARVARENQMYIDAKLPSTLVADEQVRQEYDRIMAGSGPLEYRTHRIVVQGDSAVNKALAMLKSDMSFEEAAQQYSATPDSKNGGEVPWVSFKVPLQEGQTMGVPLPIATAILEMKPGEVLVTPVTIGNTRVILRLDEVRPMVKPSYDMAAPKLRAAMESAAKGQAFEKLVGQLAQKATIVEAQ